METVDSSTLYGIISNLVTVPEDIKIDRSMDEQGVLLSVVVNSKDMGILIGKSGIMANSIKTIMRAIGKANKMNIRVEFLEPDGSIREPKHSFNVNITSDSSDIDNDASDFVLS